jgi:hypothetical protein
MMNFDITGEMTIYSFTPEGEDLKFGFDVVDGDFENFTFFERDETFEDLSNDEQENVEEEIEGLILSWLENNQAEAGDFEYTSSKENW